MENEYIWACFELKTASFQTFQVLQGSQELVEMSSASREWWSMIQSLSSDPSTAENRGSVTQIRSLIWFESITNSLSSSYLFGRGIRLLQSSRRAHLWGNTGACTFLTFMNECMNHFNVKPISIIWWTRMECSWEISQIHWWYLLTFMLLFSLQNYVTSYQWYH